MKTHIGCIISTSILYMIPAILSQHIILTGSIKYIMATIIWGFGMYMIKLYAPADTENVPILSKNERRQKQIFSYIILSLEIIIAVFINNTTISGITIFGDFIQILTITRLAYKLTNNRYGHEVYASI